MEKIISSTNYDENSHENAAPREMSDEAMQQDIAYRISEIISHDLLEKGLITEEEYKRLSALNKESYSPYLKELIA